MVSKNLVPQSKFCFFCSRTHLFAFYSPQCVCQIERIDTRLGVDFKNLCVICLEHLLCHTICSLNPTWSRNGVAIGFVVEIVAAKGVAHVHIDHSPRSQDGFMIGEVEHLEHGGNLLDALLYWQEVGSLGILDNGVSNNDDTFFLQVFRCLSKHRLSETFGHEDAPRLKVDNIVIQKLLERQVRSIGHGTEEQQGQTSENLVGYVLCLCLAVVG